MSTINEVTGDIFDLAPPNSVLMHACNCRGVWGSGVAVSFKQRFPDAYKAYQRHCTSVKPLGVHQKSLLGTTLVIPPGETHRTRKPQKEGKSYWIACLFTSLGYGKTRSKKAEILDATKRALADFLRQAEEASRSNQAFGNEIWAVRINSGKFGVDWVDTKKVLEDLNIGMTIVKVRDEINGKKEVEDGERPAMGTKRKAIELD